MRAFFEQFRPEVQQNNGLIALSALRKGNGKKIIAYITQFKLVVIRFVGILFTNDTLIHFFIQGFTNEVTFKKILKG